MCDGDVSILSRVQKVHMIGPLCDDQGDALAMLTPFNKGNFRVMPDHVGHMQSGCNPRSTPETRQTHVLMHSCCDMLARTGRRHCNTRHIHNQVGAKASTARLDVRSRAGAQ